MRSRWTASVARPAQKICASEDREDGRAVARIRPPGSESKAEKPERNGDMAQPLAHLVRVTTDNRVHQLWVASASSDEEALVLVQNRVPEGWTAALLANKLTPLEIEALNLKPGEAREIGRASCRERV